MSLSGLSRAKSEVIEDLMIDADTVVIRLQPDLRSGLVMFGHARAPAGKVYPLAEAPGIPVTARLSAAIEGRKSSDGTDVPKSASGDVLILEKAALYKGELLCGRVAARMHDGMDGKVQAMRMLARPGGTKVTEHGAFQFVTLIDPATSRKIATPEAFLEFAREVAGRRWPGGKPGFLLRNASKPFARMSEEELRENALVFPDEKEHVDAFARRMTQTNDLLANGAVEAIPAFTLPLSRDHMWREGVDLTKPRQTSHYGTVTSKYATSKKYRGFAPSLVIVGMDDEWAFRAKTGRKAQICFALQPLGPAVDPRNIHSPVRGKPEKISKTLSLYQSDAEVTEAMEARERRRPKPVAAIQAPRPATAADSPRPGVLGNLPRRPIPPVRPAPTPR